MSVQGNGTDEDDFASIYEPLSKEGAYMPFRPRAIEDLQETFKAERLSLRYTSVPPGQRIRRLASAVRSREVLRQKAVNEVPESESPLVEGKKEDERLSALRGGSRTALDVDTEAEDSEVSVELTDSGRPCVLERPEEILDGCHHLFVRSKGPLHSPDEPPDFLQLPEPIKQRTAGAARVAAAARAWAAASAPQSRLIGVSQAAGSEMQVVAVMMNQQELPPTARGAPERTPAQILQDLRQQGHDYMQQRANQQSRALEPSRPSQSQAVAGPAVLALRRMRNRMSSLADNLPWTLSPRDPSNRGRSIMPSFNRTAASSNGASSSQGPASAAAGGGGEPQMQSLVPTPPTRPKPNGRFWSRPWPRLNIMNSLGLSSGSGSSSNARGVSGSGEQSRPGTQATGARHSQQDPTPSSAQGSP